VVGWKSSPRESPRSSVSELTEAYKDTLQFVPLRGEILGRIG
jgi:hypothetical protein